ncbi:bifunctional DNA primase/polymerase [Streptomyces sp. NPDC058371]|uniref:bifunctional DNA primase/polymerase n=1 Tax=Streptomyces sp. NPDC058371 TaxID=3346463 RepID=UPI00364DEF66
MADPFDTPQSGGPFKRAGRVYAPLGYTGMVPVNASDKMLALKGVTGRDGVQTTPEQYTGPDAVRMYGDHNIGWRLPLGIIGLDVDQYEDKHGADQLAELESRLGPLPATWSSTSRGDGPSRIYFFRVPEDCGELRGNAAPDIEVIQHHHRYAIVWPSVHPSGREYAWYNGRRSDTPPALDQFAALPQAWLDDLSKPQRENGPGAGLDVDTFTDTYTKESDPARVARIRESFDSRGGCRHDTMLKALGWAARSAAEGKVSAAGVFDLLEADWKAATGGGREAEFTDLLERAVADAPDPAGDAEAPEPTELEVFAPDVSPAVREAAERMLEYKAAQRLVSQWEASQRATTTMTVSQALDAVLSGEAAVIPTVARLAGTGAGGLFYPGLVNGVYGDASVGKSVIQAEVEARILADGGIVVHWEFDNNPVMVIVARLLHAGAAAEDIRGRFHVLYSTLDRDALTADVQRAVKLVTLDALNPAVTSLGGDPYHPGGIDNAVREFFAPFTLHGACGVFVDHVGHESKDRQAGSIRKAQAVQGALYECQFEAPLKPGLTGRTRLILRKDNQGALGDQVGKTVATAVMTSEAEKGAPAGPVRTVFESPDPFVPEEKEEPKWTDEDRIEWVIRKMDEAGVPTGRGINETHKWMDGEGVKIPLRKNLKDRAIKARNHRAEKQAAVPDTGGGPTDPPPLRVSGAVPSDTR